MMIYHNERKGYFSVLSISLLMALWGIQANAKQALDDQSLSEQFDGLAKLSPIVIQAVKVESQQPIDEQSEMHKKIAKEQSDQAKKKEIYSTVLSDFEWQKKDPDPNQPSDRYVRSYEQYKPIVIGYNPYQRHDVRITTADSVTFWPGHEVDGVGYVK